MVRPPHRIRQAAAGRAPPRSPGTAVDFPSPRIGPYGDDPEGQPHKIDNWNERFGR